MSDGTSKARSMLNNLEQKVEDHPAASALVGALVVGGVIYAAAKKKED